MQMKWMKTTAAALAMLAVMGAGTALADTHEGKPGAGQAIEGVPENGEILTAQGEIRWSELEGGFWELDGYALVGDAALFAALKGQQVWVLGSRDDSPSIYMVPRLKVERMERPVAMNRILPDKVTVNGKAVTWDVAPYMHKGTLMLPLRAVAEATGAKVEWRQETQSAYVNLSDRTAYFTLGQPKAEMYLHAAMYVGRNWLEMDQSVVAQNGRLFISADALTTVLGLGEEVTADESVLALRFPQGHFDVPADDKSGQR